MARFHLTSAVVVMLLGAGVVAGQRAKQIHVEYRLSPGGRYVAVMHNDHSADATAYVGQATYKLNGKQEPTAFGGDSLSRYEPGFSLPAHSATPASSLPAGAEPLTSGVLAVIYADGFTEGDEDAVQMLLAGRHRSILDLPEAIRWLEDAGLSNPDAVQKFEQMQARNLAEAAKLDDLITIPSMMHKYFMTAVPANALPLLKGGVAPASLAPPFKKWLETLRESKPDIR